MLGAQLQNGSADLRLGGYGVGTLGKRFCNDELQFASLVASARTCQKVVGLDVDVGASKGLRKSDELFDGRVPRRVAPPRETCKIHSKSPLCSDARLSTLNYIIRICRAGALHNNETLMTGPRPVRKIKPEVDKAGGIR